MSAINIEVTKNVYDVNLQQDVTTFDVTLERGFYPLPSDIDLSNYFTKQEVIDNFKPITYNPDIDEILTNGNITNKNLIFQNSFGGDIEEIVYGHSGITSSDVNGSTGINFALKTKTAYITVPNESGTVVLDYQLNDFYTKTETFSQTEINNLLLTKQPNLGYTPENAANKSDSYTESSSTTYASSKALVDGLATKLDKGTYTGTASDLFLNDQNLLQAIQNEATARTEADNLKLNKPTSTGNTTSYPFVVGEDGNGNSARLPAGDLGKNFFNSDLSNTTARTHTMNAGVTVNTLGNPYSLTGLPNKNTDIANFRKVRVQNASGLDAVVDSKNMLTDGMTSMTDAEKDAWRLAQRKTGETYSTGMPIIRNLSRLVINSNISYVQYISLIGENLYVNPSTSTLKFIRVKDVAGAIITPVEYLIDTFTSYYDNTSLISFGLNFNLYPDGYYVLKVTNNGLESAKSPEVLLKSNYTNTPVSTNWTYIPPTYSRTQTNDILTTNSVELIGLNSSSTHQDYSKVGCVYESDFIITQEMIATNFLLEIQNYVTINGAYAHETRPTKIQILDHNNNVVAGLDLASNGGSNTNSANILPQNSVVIPTPAMGNNGLSYLLGQKVSISYKEGVLTYFSSLNQGLIYYIKTFIPNWDASLYPMGFKIRISIGGNSWTNSTVLSKKTQITNLTTI